MIDFDSITFRKIVDCLGSFLCDVPVCYTPVAKLNKTNYVLCLFMGNEEANAIRNGTHNPEIQYDNSDVGLHFPDIAISEYYYLESRRNPAAQSAIIDNLTKNRKMYIKEKKLWFSLFCILHEIGHWKHFEQSGLLAVDYEKSEHSVRDYYERQGDEIRKLPELLFYTQKLDRAKKHYEESHSHIPSEKYADEYALQNFDDALTFFRKAYGYNEEELSAYC